jgi:hypothetical protein
MVVRAGSDVQWVAWIQKLGVQRTIERAVLEGRVQPIWAADVGQALREMSGPAGARPRPDGGVGRSGGGEGSKGAGYVEEVVLVGEEAPRADHVAVSPAILQDWTHAVPALIVHGGAGGREGEGMLVRVSEVSLLALPGVPRDVVLVVRQCARESMHPQALHGVEAKRFLGPAPVLVRAELNPETTLVARALYSMWRQAFSVSTSAPPSSSALAYTSTGSWDQLFEGRGWTEGADEVGAEDEWNGMRDSLPEHLIPLLLPADSARAIARTIPPMIAAEIASCSFPAPPRAEELIVDALQATRIRALLATLPRTGASTSPHAPPSQEADEDEEVVVRLDRRRRSSSGRQQSPGTRRSGGGVVSVPPTTVHTATTSSHWDSFEF